MVPQYTELIVHFQFHRYSVNSCKLSEHWPTLLVIVGFPLLWCNKKIVIPQKCLNSNSDYLFNTQALAGFSKCCYKVAMQVEAHKLESTLKQNCVVVVF